MKNLIVTPKRLNVDRLAENDRYLTNGFWMIDKTQVDMNMKIIKNIYVAYTKSTSPYKENSHDITVEACQKVIDRALEGTIEPLETDNMVKDLGYEYLHIDFVNPLGSITRLNAYFVAFMRKLGGVYFEQTSTYSYQPVIVKNAFKKIVGVIMPMRI